MQVIESCQLYSFVDAAYLRGRDPVEVTRRLCDGGSDIIQLRAKGISTAEVARMAEQIVPITEGAGVHLVINDHVEVASRQPCPFVHLGQEDFFDAGFRHTDELRNGGSATAASNVSFGTSHRELRVGLSTHGPAQAERAMAADPDYVAIGPVFTTGTKPSARPVTLEYVRWAAQHVTIPWFAIGGITLENVESVLEAGARRICVVSAILNAPDIARACQEFKARLESAAKT